MSSKKLKQNEPSIMEIERTDKLIETAIKETQKQMAPKMALKYAQAAFLWGLGFGVVIGVGVCFIFSKIYY